MEAPIILMEHGLLVRLGMTSSDHWAEPVTALTIVTADSPLAAGLPAGDHVVYSKSGEFFWGIPSANAIKVATVKGAPTHWVIFAYPAGAMMVGKEARRESASSSSSAPTWCPTCTSTTQARSC